MHVHAGMYIYKDIIIKYIAKHIYVHTCIYIPLYILINGDNIFDICS